MLRILQLAFHQQADFIFRQKAAGRFLLLDFILTERVAREPLIVDGDEHHRPKRADIQPHGIGAAVSVRRNISKSEMKAGVSSFRAMSFTW